MEKLTGEQAAPHRLVMEERSGLSLTGVIEVESFDDSAIVLSTTKGTLVVQGSGLQLQSLNPEGGQVHLEGLIDSLRYEAPTPAGGFFARLFG